MADKRAFLVTRADKRGVQGYITEMEVATGVDDDGHPTFDGTKVQIPSGRTVLNVAVTGGDLLTGLYLVRQGNPMAAVELQPKPGDLIRVTSTQVSRQIGSSWLVAEDGSLIEDGHAANQEIRDAIEALGRRIPPPLPDLDPPEGDEEG